MGGKQRAMRPGETFEYELEFPDTGVFWYHPHLREDYTQEMGLYGNYWVDEPEYWDDVDREEFMVIDDFSENDPFYKEVTNKTMMGRYGNLLMINNDVDYNLQVRSGETVRFFMTNTANTRVFDVEVKNKRGVSMPLKVVGGDIGRIEHEYFTQSIITAPAERYIFELNFDLPGEYTVEHRGQVFGHITVVGNEAVADTGEPNILRDNPSDYELIRSQLSELLARPADKTLRMTIGMKGAGEMRRGTEHKNGEGKMMGGRIEDIEAEEREMGGTPHLNDEGGIEWEDGMEMMNNMSNTSMMEWMLVDEDSGKVSMDIDDWSFKQGSLVKVRLYNDPGSMHPMQHPIHFHGQRFVILARDGKPNDNLQWKDTALVRTGETMDIVVEMSNVGDWMAHCHIAEHLHAGMMLNFKVVK
jgi:FtsP/CotA-like multicopper oxidase with cupredoxin domain